MKKLTSKQKVMVKRAVFSAAVVTLMAVAVVVTLAGVADLVFEPYSSIRKAVGAFIALFGVSSIVGLFYIWDELILTNTYKREK